MDSKNNVEIILDQQNFYKGPVTIHQHYIRDNPTNERADAENNVNNQQNSRRKIPEPCKSAWDYRWRILSALVIILIFVRGYFSLFPPNGSKSRSSMEDENTASGNSARLISRKEWSRRTSFNELDRLNLPVHRVIITSTSTENCTTQSSCTYKAQVLQSYHMDSLSFDDIGYNFLIGGDGIVYEGRGWDFVGAHTKGYNADSICLAFIGTFTKLVPPERQLNAAKVIIQEGVRLNKLVEDYRLYGSRQLMATDSPGNALYEIIKQWPNWSSEAI